MVKKLMLFIFTYLILQAGGVYAQKTYDEKHIEVALRMIGDAILKKSGDHTSRVLPITKNQDQYKIQFESELVIHPDDLITTVNEVVKKTKIHDAYIVEVSKCETKEVVYSYEVDNPVQTDTMQPCRGRPIPKACYDILFVLKKGKGASVSAAATKDGGFNSKRIIYPIVLLLLLLPGVLFFLRKKKTEEPKDPDLITIGLYQFNKRNAVLSLHNEKTELSGKESDLLLMLHENANDTLDRDDILKAVWGDEGNYIGRTLDVFISKLRKKLEGDSNIKIVNIRGVGYKLVVDE